MDDHVAVGSRCHRRMFAGRLDHLMGPSRPARERRELRAGIHSHELVYGFAIENTGPFDVQVTHIEVPAIPGYLWSPKVEVAAPGAYAGDVGVPREPFEPFTIGSGEERAIILSGRTSCTGTRRGQDMAIGAINVEFKVLGLSKTRTIPLWLGLQVNPTARVCDPPPPPSSPVFPDPTNSRL